MNNSSHTVHYKGYAIICENGLYKIQFEQTTYLTFEAVKTHVDALVIRFANDVISRSIAGIDNESSTS